jgi:hypothetical protein
MDDRALELLDAWWEIGEEGWYSQSDETDAMLKDRFSDLVEARAPASSIIGRTRRTQRWRFSCCLTSCRATSFAAPRKPSHRTRRP